MFSVFARHLSPTILRQNVYSHISRVVTTPTLRSRPFASTPLANLESPMVPREMKKDQNWDDIAVYTESHAAKLSPEQIWSAMSERHLAVLPPSIYAGRSVPVKHGDISRAMNSLSTRLRANRVQKTWKYQMRHEKKGVKRRRLKSERWRRRFADEIRRKIELVRSIQRRGQ